jgi:hypothetical protein
LWDTIEGQGRNPGLGALGKQVHLYSYPYLSQQKPLFLPIIAYTLSSTKLKIRAK